MHNPLSLHDLVSDELRQRAESGHAVQHLIGAAESLAEASDEELLHLADALDRAPVLADWPYAEGQDLVFPSLTGDEPILPLPSLDRFLGAWQGRIVGCMLGKPFEEGRRWTPALIEDYLRTAGAYPLRDYVPVIEPMPSRFELRESWPRTTKGRVRGGDRDDDLDYSVLALLMLEQHGGRLTTDLVAESWLGFLPFTRTYTAERAAYRNLVSGVPPCRAGTERNPYREWIGALIRADVHGWVHYGRPRAAASSVDADARLSHRGNGIAAAHWAAGLSALALVENDALAVLDGAHGLLPPGSRIEAAVTQARELHATGAEWEPALRVIRATLERYEWVHAVNNAALIAAGLLWSDGDFACAIGRTVEGGWDTDSSAATVGGIMGALTGSAHLPAHFVEPLEDSLRSAVFGHDHSSISDLAQRTRELASQFGA
ncbi:MAG: ADP-ribosylglycohydrolase family protein [Microbacteriaceae bacterium]|nr:ADP-ribosylglycohydrolase family protein [Microbacteriaceae bacterium]